MCSLPLEEGEGFLQYFTSSYYEYLACLLSIGIEAGTYTVVIHTVIHFISKMSC